MSNYLSKNFVFVISFLCIVLHLSNANAQNKKYTPTPVPSVQPLKVKDIVPDVPVNSTLTPAQQLELQNKKFITLESFSRALNYLESMYVDEKSVSSDLLMEKALKGMVGNIDPHTIYLSPQDLREFDNDTSGKFGGIGIVVSRMNNKLEIVDVLPDSPASVAGVVSGEVILSIDGIQVTQQNMDDLSDKIRGTPGSSIKLELQFPAKKTNGQPITRNVIIQRQIIHTQSVTHAKLADGYVYLRIAIFQKDTGENVDKVLKSYEDQSGGKLKGLILDLRNNPGGLLDQAVRVADLFIDSGIIVSTIGRDKNKQDVEYASKRTTHPYMPIIVITNRYTASASEIVAGALQDHDRAIILGATTFGKGSVQSIIGLPNGGGLKITVARYYTPKGRTIQAKGITPDIPVEEASVQSRPNNTEPAMKNEADLENHLEANDLKAEQNKESYNIETDKWPIWLKNDNLVRISYNYLRGWTKLKLK